ncbi:MAG: Ig domain-containing protein, partial [Acidobacteriota bacterium]|nr:Ig domain-containing protein [Acidobacteriota bacterium]
ATGCPITISPANLNAGQLGVNYNQALSQSGGMGTINWTVNVGSLPAGLMLDQSTGVLSGMPSAPGTFGFTIRATAANGCYGEQPYMLVINCQSLSISPATLNAGTYGNLYSQQLTLMGGSGVTNWTVSAGSLPSGLGLNQTSGLLSGTPGMVGMFSFTVKGTVNSTGCFATQAYTLTIGCQTISIDQPTINSGTINVPYSQQLSQTGGAGNITWTLSSGPLPNNLTLSPGGLISGTPTVSGGFPITVRATDTNGCFNEKIYTLTVNCQTINITPATLNTGVINTGYSQQLSQTGGAGNITWTLSPGSQPLPNNLTLSSGGLISGTPTVSGGFSITVRATDANGCFNDKAYTLMIDCQTITITTASLNPGAIGSNYNQQLSQSGGVGITWTLSSGSLPSNLTLSASGLISGIPSVSGSFPITVKAAQSNGCFGEKQFLLLVNCQPINITPATLNPGVLGTNYNQPLTQTGGSGSIAWTISAGAMPSGITLNSTSGLLSGMPASAGTFNFTVRAAETNNCFGEKAYTLVINCQSLSITPATLNSAMIVTNYSQQLSLTGGSGSIDWTIVAGALPSGITLHPTSGLLSGLPNVSGTFNFTVKAAISTTGCFAQQAYTLVITCPAITVDPPTISSGSLGVP